MSYTVEELVAQGFARNAEMKYYEAEVAASKGERTKVGLWKNPEFTGEYGQRRVTNGESGSLADGFTRSASLSQTFEFPGKGSLRKAIANKEIEIAELGLRQFRLALAGQIRSLAYQYLAASEQAEAAGEVEERSTALVKLLGERSSAGTQQFLELRIIQGSLIELQKGVREATRQRDEAALELNRLLGLPASQPLRIKTPLSLPSLTLDRDTLVLQGLAGNLLLKTRIVELEKAVRSVSAAKLDIAPNFAVGPFFSQDRAGDNEENVGIGFSTTLPLWDWNQGNIAAAKAKREQADALLLDARRKTEAEILRRLRSYELVQKQLAKTPEGIVSELREAAALADRQYRTGVIGIQLFLETQRGYLSVQQSRNEAVLSAWSDILDIELLTGHAEGELK
ncbi:TolC family protein [Verrucomicrobium sp. GAS474]|uniref:TolC family protein n=1 Tax=Verrucomicrobium sp. GAS474 TaxID=1882831 RepID=UPI001390642A|nr:TolC family protein [Verrucomicrobium sp. GAS474]